MTSTCFVVFVICNLLAKVGFLKKKKRKKERKKERNISILALQFDLLLLLKGFMFV